MHQASEQLGRDSVGRLLFRFSIPSIIGMVVNALYSVVDRAYIGRVVGADAIAGMTLAIPVMIAITAFGMLIGIGTATLISLSLGRGSREDAEKCLGQAVALFIALYLILPPIAFIYMDDLLHLLGGTEAMIPYARQYLQIILATNIVQHLSFGLNNSMRAEGFPGRALATLLIGAVLNAILDPLFIFPEFFGWGIRGAAVATAISQTVSTVWVLAHFLSPRSAARLRWKNIRIHPPLALRMMGIGLAPFAMQFIASLIAAAFNRSFRIYADPAECSLAMAAMGTIQVVTMLLIMPMFGLTQGMQPIVGYNYAALQYDRVRRTFKLALVSGLVIGVTGALFCWTCAPLLANLFAPADRLPELHAVIPHYLRVMTLAFPVVGFSITTGQYFLSIGKVAMSMTMSLMRQVIFLLPALLILPRFFGVEGIWYSAPVSDFLSFAVAIVCFFHEQRHLRVLMYAPAPEHG